MNKLRDLLNKTLAVGVIILLGGTGVFSSTGNAIKVNNPFVNLEIIESCFNGENDTNPPVTMRTLNPLIPDGLNGWYVSDVTIILNATDDLSGVKEIKYIINGWSIHTIQGDNGSFIIVGDGEDILIEYWAIDNAGNVEPRHKFRLDIDKSKPNLKSYCNVVGGNQFQGWDFLFIANATDELSGMELVEFYLNKVLQETVYGPGPKYTWQIRAYPLPTWYVKTMAYDNAGNVDIDYAELSRTYYFLLNLIFFYFTNI